jgi:hypothetical protein
VELLLALRLQISLHEDRAENREGEAAIGFAFSV